MAKIIPLTQGQVTIVDDEDFEKYGSYKWCAHFDPGTSTFYVVRSVRISSKKAIHYKLHRLIVGATDGELVDHINHDTLDNRKFNLRKVSHSQNMANRRGATRANKTGYRGVSWNSDNKKYQASIRVNGVLKHIGWFMNPQDAAGVAEQARLKYFGEFAGANQ